jgi:hypothetical protein
MATTNTRTKRTMKKGAKRPAASTRGKTTTTRRTARARSS